jgi:hypothetical protein
MGIRPASKLAARKAAASCRTPKLRTQSVGGVRRDNNRKDLLLDDFGAGWKPALRLGLGHCQITVGHADIRLAHGTQDFLYNKFAIGCGWPPANCDGNLAMSHNQSKNEIQGDTFLWHSEW